MGFLRPLECFIGVFQRLFGIFVSGLVIFFPVVHGGSTVGVCGEFMELGSLSVRVIWHSVSHPPMYSILKSFHFRKLSNCEHSRLQ